jgi:hypothetical protein
MSHIAFEMQVANIKCLGCNNSNNDMATNNSKKGYLVSVKYNIRLLDVT